MSGYNEQIWFHPSEPGLVFLTPDMLNAYRSTDDGNVWDVMKNPDGKGHDVTRLNGIDFSAHNAKFGLAVNRQGLWYTRDKGCTWHTRDSWVSFTPGDIYGSTTPPPPGQVDQSIFGGTLSAVAFDPRHGNVVYVGSGDFFNQKLNHHTAEYPHGELPDPDYFWRTNTGKIWKSTSHGQHWTLINHGIHPLAEIGRIIVHPADSARVFAATSYGFYRSDDGGQSWDAHNNGLDNGIIRDLTMHYDRSTRKVTLFAIDQVEWAPDGHGSVTSTGGVFRSTDHGQTWQNISDGLRLNLAAWPGMHTNRILRTVYFRALGWWFSMPRIQAEATFFQLPSDVLQQYNRIAVDPQDVNKLYVLGDDRHHGGSFLPAGPWTTDDGGASWYVAARTGTGWHTDRGFWRDRHQPLDVNMEWGHKGPSVERQRYDAMGHSSLGVSPAGHVWMWDYQTMFRSVDQGSSWQAMDETPSSLGPDLWVSRGNSNVPGREIVSDVANQRVYICLGENGLWRTDGTVDPHKAVPPAAPVAWPTSARSISTMALAPDDPQTMYLIPDRQNHVGELRRSADGGITWDTVSTPLPDVGQAHALSLVIHPHRPTVMYFCVPAKLINSSGHIDQALDKRGVFVSLDAGHTWSTRNNGLPGGHHASVNHLALGTGPSGVVYAAVLEQEGVKGGLFKTSDDGAHWVAVPVPEPVIQVNHVHVHACAGGQERVYISAGRLSGLTNTAGHVVSTGTVHGDVNAGGVWYTDDDGRNWTKIFSLPNVYRATTSPWNREHVLVDAGPADAIGGINPGIFLSTTLGRSWRKVNHGLGEPDRVYDVQFDPARRGVMWCSLRGAGAYVATYSAVS